MTRSSLDVVMFLRCRMNEIVRDYGDTDPDGVRRVDEPIDGTAFFPEGHGLWRGFAPHGPLPAHFPEAPVMFVGHNFDKVSGYLNSLKRGIEVINGHTWRKLREYISFAGLTPEQCFFTNALMGLQPQAALGTLKTTERFRKECRAFLNEQIAVVRPRALVPLGPVATADVAQIDSPIPTLSLLHPYASIRRPDIAPSEGRRLGAFLRTLREGRLDS